MDSEARRGLTRRWARLEHTVDVLRTTHYPADAHDAISDDAVRFLESLYPLWDYWCRVDLTLNNMRDQDNKVRGDRSSETVAALACARGGIPHDLVEFVSRTGDAYGSGRYGVGPYGVGYWAWAAYSTPKQGYEDRNEWYAEWVYLFTVAEIAVAALEWFQRQPSVQVPI